MLASHKSPQPSRNRLRSKSPDPIKSSILRESGMGWTSPPPDTNDSPSNGETVTSPLRIAKKESPRSSSSVQVARRTSSSYKHVRNNRLVSKSPFKSQIPMPSTPSRPSSVSFPVTRRVSGEKRPRPLSIYEQTETENDRPFALKRERRQSKGFQGLIEKEPVSKSPFRLQQFASPLQTQAPPTPSTVATSRLPVPSSSQIPAENIASSSNPTPSPNTGPSPARSSLVSRRLHGPRLSGSGRRERRKTVTFDERCDVVEFDRDEDEDEEEVFESESEDGIYGEPEPRLGEDDDPFFQGEILQSRPSHPPDIPDEDGSYDSIHLSDIEVEPNNPSLLRLDPDASITGLVDEMFASNSALSDATIPKFNTPPLNTDIHPDLETENSVPIGRTHHSERILQHHQQQYESPHITSPHFSPKQSSGPLQSKNPSPALVSPSAYPFNLGLPTHASPLGPPATPPRRPPITATNTPPLGRSTHVERVRKAREEETVGESTVDDDLRSLPVSPSPMKKPITGTLSEIDELLPRFDVMNGLRIPEDSSSSGPDPFAHSRPNVSPRYPYDVDEFSNTTGKDDSLNLSIGNSEINLSGLGRDPEMPTVNAEKEENVLHDEPFFEESIRSFSPVVIGGSRSSPLLRDRSRSPIPVPPRMSSPLFRATSPLLTGRNRSGSNTSLTGRQRITREDVQRRLLKRRSFGSPAPETEPEMQRSSSTDPLHEPCKGEDRVLNNEGADAGKIGFDSCMMDTPIGEQPCQANENQQADTHMQQCTDSNRDDGVEQVNLTTENTRSIVEEKPQEKEFGIFQADSPPVDLGAMHVSDSPDSALNKHDSLGVFKKPRGAEAPMESISSGSSSNSSATAVDAGPHIKMDFADVDMDMKSALDRLMDDVAGVGGREGEDSIMTDECEPYDQGPGMENGLKSNRAPLARAMTEPTPLLHTSTGIGFSPDKDPSKDSASPPPLPPKDNIRSREQMILEKRREARRLETESDEYLGQSKDYCGTSHLADQSESKQQQQQLLGVGRPSRRRSMSTGDADALRHSGKRHGEGLLDGVMGEVESNDALADSIERELKKLVEPPRKTKYQVRQREETIYASSCDPDDVSHMSGPGDVNAGKAWRTVRRPSDMNEYSKQIKEYRAQEKPGKAYGKVFVKVMGIKNMHLPLPQQSTSLTCTLNNGIHFVTTPECQLGQNTRIGQEFELIEHNKLEFTLALKVKRDPHIVAQFKALSPPAPVSPPIVQQTTSKGGMRSFFSSSPKKPSKVPAQVLTPPVHRIPENLARYMKPDGTLARAFVAFKDIAARCDTRLFETSYPLIGQRFEVGGKFSTQQVGELVLQIFRLPPLPGIAPDQLPQSLEECHRGLRHINWHKVTYFEGTLTQSGGDCTTWRRRQFRVIGANLVAFNDVTKKATATIDLKKAVSVEDDQDMRSNALSPASGRSVRYGDEYDVLYGVERSFRLIFPHGQEIAFFADTNEEKTKWLEIFRAMVGHIPPHPLWGELIWQRQEELTKRTLSRSALQSHPSS
ncbi:hypothetical protein AX17_004020 [Amanita inopinata Kibby_2008]|nr:hypothetical protein AX17_004020 [Amanita inopinata Kibby_2008]